MKVAIVLCYGLFDESNTEYCQYLKWISNDVHENNLEKIIVCGGYSNNQKPQLSEAQTVRDYLQMIDPQLPVIELEDQSLTTNQNLEFASQKTSSDDYFFVYCDLARLAKVIWLSANFLQNKNRNEIADTLFDFAKDKQIKPFLAWNLCVKGFEFPSRDKYQYLNQSFSSILEVESIYNKTLDEKIITQRHVDFQV